MPTFEELVSAISAILPEAEFGEDGEGQVIIYTNLAETSDGSLVVFEAE